MSDNVLGEKASIVKRFLTETRSVDELASYFTDDAFYRVGNTEPLIGRDRIRESSVRFRQGIKRIVHDIKQIWELGNTVVVEIEVTYTRNDDKVVTIPCLDVIELEGDKFKAIHIYMDISPVFAPMTNTNYAERDKLGQVVFYVPLWKRKGITLELFDDYWRNVHGPVCARLPGQHQYWQFHVAHPEGGTFPQVEGVSQDLDEEDKFDGIAELSFKSPEDRQTWFQSAAILMDDEHNIFSQAIGYNSSPSNSVTYIDGIANGAPNGKVGVEKFHVLVRKADGVTVDEFRQYLKETFAPTIIKNPHLLKFRLHLFDEFDDTRPDAVGVSHHEAPEKQYQAAFEIAFATRLDLEYFFASTEYQTAIKDQPKYVKHISPFPERTAYAFVYDSKMTLAGQRSSTVAELITNIGAVNQLQDDIVELIVGKVD